MTENLKNFAKFLKLNKASVHSGGVRGAWDSACGVGIWWRAVVAVGVTNKICAMRRSVHACLRAAAADELKG